MTSRTTAPHIRQANSAHRTTVELSTQEVARQLADNLGINLAAYIVSRNEQTFRRWVDGTQQPTLSTERLLRSALYVFELVAEADRTRHVARSWFIGMNPQLNELSPAEVLRDGNAREVVAAAQAYITGG